MSPLFPVLAVLVVVAALIACAALFVPKGPHQVTIRTTLILTFVATYLMWMITYLAQLHPLIQPFRSVTTE